MQGPYKEAEISPLVEKVPIYINAIRLGQVFRDQLSYCWEVERLLVAVVLHIVKVRVWVLLGHD